MADATQMPLRLVLDGTWTIHHLHGTVQGTVASILCCVRQIFDMSKTIVVENRITMIYSPVHIE